MLETFWEIETRVRRVEKEKRAEGEGWETSEGKRAEWENRWSKIPAMVTWLRAKRERKKKERKRRCWKKKTGEKGPVGAKEDAKWKKKSMEMEMKMENEKRKEGKPSRKRGERTGGGLDGGKKRLKEKEVWSVCMYAHDR